MTLSPRAIGAAAEEFCKRGIHIDCPGYGDMDDIERERYEALIAAITAYLDAIAVDGLCLAPKEPTMAMLYAGERAWINDPLKRSSTLYRAMIAAASDGEDRVSPPAGTEG